MKVGPEFPFKYKWDRRIGSPRKLFRSLQDFLDEYQYRYGEFRELKAEEASPIDGVARFEDAIKGKRDFSKWSKPQLIVSLALMLAGIILLTQESYWVGIGILIVGIVLAVKSKSTMRRVIKFRIAGESYRAGAHGGSYNASSVEVLGVVSDVRLIIEAEVGSAKGEDNISKLTKNTEEQKALETELRGLKERVDELLPKLELPTLGESKQL